MKKLLLLFIGLLWAVQGWGYDFSYGGFYFQYNTYYYYATAVYVTHNGSNSYSGNKIIPETAYVLDGYQYKSYPVVKIGDYAFQNSPGLTSVTIPSSCTYIGTAGFAGCSGLTSIDVRHCGFGEAAFTGCSNLESILLKEDLNSIPNSSFYNCSKLSNITIPNTVTSIGEYAFRGCESLSSISIPNGVSTICDYAFCDCSNLTSITLPNSLSSISSGCFMNCSKLRTIIIPSSITEIYGNAFRNSNNINSLMSFAETPPTVNNFDISYFLPHIVVIYVPAESVSLYQTTYPWYNYNIQALPSYMVDAQSIPTEGGIIEGCGSYVFGSQVTLTATANTGFEFVNWTKGEEVISTNPSYTFTVNEAVNLIANFNMQVYTFSGFGSWITPSNWTAPDGTVLTTMPDLSYENVVIDGMAFIPNGTYATVKSLTINPEKVLEINSGASLTVAETIENDDDANSLILNDGGQIFQNNENVKATFKKNITNPTVWGNTRSGWNLISSPIVNTTIESFISQDENYDLYIWDGSADELEWINYKSHSDDEDYEDYFDTYLNCENEFGYGYLASYKTTNVASFTGVLRILDADGFDFDVYGQKNGEWENMNLLGNPLPFDISSADFERSKVAAGFATLDPLTNSIVYHSNEGTIKVGQGFFVQATGKSPSLSYSTDSKSTRETSKFIDVTVSGKEGHDNVILDFSGSDNEGFVKLTSFNESIATIFTVEDNRMYGISNYDSDVKEIPLCFDAKEIGTYTISMKPSGDFNYIHLIDRMTGEDIDMLLEGEYKFNALASDNVNRFIVRLSNDDEINGNDNFAYQSGNKLFVNGNGTIQIFDMIGRVVINETLSGNSVDISCLRNAAYIVRLVSENGVKTQKIVVL